MPLRGLSSMATKAVLADLATRVSRSGPEVVVESAGGVAVAHRLREGERADLVVLAHESIVGLAGESVVVPGSIRPLFRSEAVLAIPSDAPTPGIATRSEVIAALAAAHRIGYSTGPSGDALLLRLSEWGLRPGIEDRLVQTRPGVSVARLLADGGADIGVQQRSEFAGVDGVRVLGALPADCAITTVFTAAVLSCSTRPDAAAAVIAGLADAAYDPVVRSHGLERPQPSDGHPVYCSAR